MNRATLFRGIATQIRKRQWQQQHHCLSYRCMSTISTTNGGSRRDKEAEKHLLRLLDSNSKIELSHLSSMLVGGRDSYGRIPPFKNKFNTKILDWLEDRPHLVQVEAIRGKGNEIKYYAHRVVGSIEEEDTVKQQVEMREENLNLLTVQALKELARLYNLKPGKLKKAELIEALSK